jgi:sugar/nucleoside kinase (ribokinase family)
MKTKTTSNTRRGLLVGGNWTIDQIKLIDAYPQPEQLATIRSQSQSFGGAPYNVLMDLAIAGAPFPLSAAGMLGGDAAGTDILAECKRLKIDTKNVGTTDQAATSFTDVMTEAKGGRRTFFHSRGANALWQGDGLDFGKLKAKIFHMGYLLLLDALDAGDDAYGTKAARLLAAAQSAGLKTSLDVITEDSDRYREIVPHALKFTDYFIINEEEAARITGFKTREANGQIDTVSLRHAAGALLQLGVKELIVIHFPEGGFMRTRRGEDIWQSSVKLPEKVIAGTTGAGDAYCAGVLWGLHEGWELPQCLKTAACLAAACLTDATTTRGLKPLAACQAMGKKYGFRPALERADF